MEKDSIYASSAEQEESASRICSRRLKSNEETNKERFDLEE